jgi:hypothetical protein
VAQEAEVDLEAAEAATEVAELLLGLRKMTRRTYQ